MVTLFTLGIICLAAVILIPVILFLVGLPFLLLMGLLPWLLRIAGVVLRIKALEAFQAAADGKATKIIIPSEIQGLAGLCASAKAVFDSVEPNKPKPPAESK